MPKNADIWSQLGFGYTNDAPTYNTVGLNSDAEQLSNSQMNRAKAGRQELAKSMMRGVDQTPLAHGAANQIASYSAGLGGDQAKLMGNALSNRMSKNAANDLMGVQTNQANQARLLNAQDLGTAAAGRGTLADIARNQVSRADEDYANVQDAQNKGWGQFLSGAGTLAGMGIGALAGMPGKGGKQGGDLAGNFAKDDTADVIRGGATKGAGMGGLIGRQMGSMYA